MKSLMFLVLLLVLGCASPEEKPRLINATDSSHVLMYKTMFDDSYYLKSRDAQIESCMKCHQDIRRIEKGDFGNGLTHRIIIEYHPMVVIPNE